MTWQVEVSYMEIFNESGYDLLDPKRAIRHVEDLRRVQALELEDGSVHLRNLALQPVSSVEDALSLVCTCIQCLRLSLQFSEQKQ